MLAGISNFNISQCREVLDSVKKHKPTVLQNECHPYLQQKDIIDFCKANGIGMSAHWPFVPPRGNGVERWAFSPDPRVYVVMPRRAALMLCNAHGQFLPQIYPQLLLLALNDCGYTFLVPLPSGSPLHLFSLHYNVPSLQRGYASHATKLTDRCRCCSSIST